MAEDLHIVWQATVKTFYVIAPIVAVSGLIGYVFAKWLED